MFEFAQHTMVGLACVIVPASLLLWLLALDRLFKGHSLLDLEPRRPVPWSLVDLLLIGFVGFAVLTITQLACLKQLDLPKGNWDLADLSPGQQVYVLLTFSASSIVTWAVAVIVCRWRSGASLRDLGWDPNRWQRDCGLGLIAFVMLIVPVLSIHFIAQKAFPTDETHPFIDLIMNDPKLAYLWPIGLAALVVAPLVEEYFFRVLLQGWLERRLARREWSRALPMPSNDALSDETRDNQPMASNEPSMPPQPPASPGSFTPTTATWAAAAERAENPYHSPSLESLSDDARQGQDEAATTETASACRPPPGLPQQPLARMLAISGSALAFALARFWSRARAISLFVLALGLGYLYQRTHRVLPSMVVHFLVNLTAVAQLAMAILENRP